MVQAQELPRRENIEPRPVAASTPQSIVQALAEGRSIDRTFLSTRNSDVLTAIERTDFLARMFQLHSDKPEVFGPDAEIGTWMSDNFRLAPRETQFEVIHQVFMLLYSKRALCNSMNSFCVGIFHRLQGQDFDLFKAQAVKSAIEKQAESITQSNAPSSDENLHTNGQELKRTLSLVSQLQNEKKREVQKLGRCVDSILNNAVSLRLSERQIEVFKAEEAKKRRELEALSEAIAAEQQKCRDQRVRIDDDYHSEVEIATKGAELEANILKLQTKQDELQKKDDEHRRNIDKLSRGDPLGTEEIVIIVREWRAQPRTIEMLMKKGMTGRYLRTWPYEKMLECGLPVTDALRFVYYIYKLLHSIPLGEIEQESWTVEDVTHWMMSVPGAEDAVEHFRRAQIDGIGLLQLTEKTDYLDRIGVENCTVQDAIRSAVEKLPGRYQLIPKEMYCVLSQRIMTDPVTASDGHNYERGTIVNYLNTDGDKRSPVTDEPLTGHFDANPELKRRIAAFLAAEQRSKT